MNSPRPLPHEIQVGVILGIRVWYVKEGLLYSSNGWEEEFEGTARPIPRVWPPKIPRVARRDKSFTTCGTCPKECTAPCTLTPKELSANTGLQCGIHASSNLCYFPSHVAPYSCGVSPNGDIVGHSGYNTRRVVFGLARLFGRVIEGAKGWRAEFAEAHVLCPHVPSKSFQRCSDLELQTLSERYAAPILTIDEMLTQVTKPKRKRGA